MQTLVCSRRPLLIDDKIGAALNRNLGSPTAPGEAVEAELDRLIERRSRQKGPDEKSELWKAGVSTLEGRRRKTTESRRIRCIF